MGAGYLIILFYLMINSLLAQEYRLSRDIIPDLYDIHIKPFLRLEDAEKQFTFEGQVNLTLHSVVDNVNEITLHKDLIDILSAILYDGNGNLMQDINNESLIYDRHTNKLTIHLAMPLVVGEYYNLYFKYLGQIRNGMEGFYRATDDNVNWYGITQLHMIAARTVFPCFDEPEFKAKFRMHISRTREYKSFFNTRLIKSTNDGNDRIDDHFEETPLMSTYLVAFLISDFDSHGDENLQIITRAESKNKSNFAFEVGMRALNTFSNYTQLHYKSLGNNIMQMVGTDRSPHSGMENWGLVVYKESTLVQEPGYTDDSSHKQYTVAVVVHETAHMWFGNSVTHKWWSYFWLNEGFPNYYQYFLANELYPEYEFDKQFIIDELHYILDLDATNATQPLSSLEKSINTPTEIGSKFSKIAYAKGASVIRMFKNLMGKENFDMAIREYLKENLFKTSTPYELFKQFKKYWPSDDMLDLDEFFKDWTEQMGYPMVIVSISSCGRYALRQQRFLLDPSDGSDADLKYTVPVTLTYDDKVNDFKNLSPKFYLHKNQTEMLIGNATQHKWIVVNNQQSNYYRVFYDTKILGELKIAFMNKNHSGIHVNNRANIIDDLFAYARIGLRGYDEVFDFMEYLAKETEYSPWQAAFKGFERIYQRLTLAQHNKFGEYLCQVLDKIYKKLGLANPNDSILHTYTRNKVISWLCRYHHEDCNTQVQTNFQSHVLANTKPNPDIRETIYCAVLRNNNSYALYGNFKELFLKQQLSSEKEKILRAMGCTRYFVRDHYEFTLTHNVASELKAVGLKSLYSQTPENIDTAFNIILDGPEQLAEVLKNWSTTASVIKDISQYLTTEEQLVQLKEFTRRKGNLFNTSISILESSIELVEKNLKWSRNHFGKLMNYLVARNVRYRLTNDIVPNHYDIHLKAYLKPEDGDKQFKFDGEVNITIQVANTRGINLRKITLHTKDIDILKAVLYDANGKLIENITSGSMLQETLTDKLTVHLLMPLAEKATYILYFKYQGKIDNGLAGFFRATYNDARSWYGITQLQRINARTAFPCFDEPAFKAKFRMHISRPKEYSAVFNTRLIKSTIDGDANYVDHFEETPLMSTYLVGFLISDFKSFGNESFKFIMHPKFTNKTNFAFEVGLNILSAYDNYTQLPYKSLGNTIMQMAGSARFPHNGMENWGLVMYKDKVLAQEPGYTDGWSDKEYTINILTHELSHMWFGNSVTFKWWNCFWLNEAFARYYQYFFAHQLYPEYELDKQFVVKQVQLILEADATNKTQPLTSRENSINTPAEIGKKSGIITYAKGATIVRMFANLMGTENFDNAIREYLKENHLNNVLPENLFKFLKRHWPREHQVDLEELFSDWTEQPGYPMVTVSIGSNGKFLLRQKRFSLGPKNDSDASIRYTIPITFNNERENDYHDFSPAFYFNKTLEEVEFGSAGQKYDWIIVNTQQSNYFRVFYHSELLSKLRIAFEQHGHSGIHVSNRASVIDDLLTFGSVGVKDYAEIFEFMEYLATETEYTPWYAAFKGLKTVYARSTLEQHKVLDILLYKLLDKVYKKLGFENVDDTILDVYNRNEVISWLCKMHHEDCNTKARQIFHSHMLAGTKPTPDFREVLYCAACRNDESDIYENLKKMFRKEKLGSEKEKILRAMSCTRYNVQSHYKFILSNSVPLELKIIGLNSLYTRTPENIMTVFKLMTENIEMLAEALQSWTTTASITSDISNYFTTQEQLMILKQFTQQKGHLSKTFAKSLESSIKSTEENLRWAMNRLNNLFIYLSKRQSASAI